MDTCVKWEQSGEVFESFVYEAWAFRCKLDDGRENAREVTTEQACVNSGISLSSVQNRRPYITIKLPRGDMDTPLRPRNLLP